MPAFNPFAPLIEVGGQANVAGVQGGASAAIGMGGASDNHVAAGLILIGLIFLVFLHRQFRFSAKVGG